jgi:hypothetical protein
MRMDDAWRPLRWDPTVLGWAGVVVEDEVRGPLVPSDPPR